MRHITFILAFFVISGCWGVKPLRNPKMPLTHKAALKLDGYYSVSGKGRLYFFYIDGTASLFSVQEKPLDINHLMKLDSHPPDIPYLWGVFHLLKDTILIEEWIPSHGGKSLTERSYGLLLNDSTFVINNRENAYATKQSELWEIKKDTFHFFNFFPKPDSLNQFTN